MVKEDRSTWKQKYFVRLVNYLNEYNRCFIVGIDNVGSKQMQQIRGSLRGKAVVLMGKNTMIRKCIKGHLENNPKLERLLAHVRGNVGFVFTDGELTVVRDLITANKVPAQARAGAIAPCDVMVPAQNTGLGPEKTAFFQALHISTKISRGTIEIINDVPLIKEGNKVGASEATLLNMLKISPFTYGMVIRQVYDNGSVFPPNVLNISPNDIKNKVIQLSQAIAAISLEINYPTVVSVPHSMMEGLRKVFSISLATDYSVDQLKELKELLSDPTKLAAMQAASAPAAKSAKPADAPVEKKKEEPKKEEKVEEEEEGDMGFGLFD